jgi:hypothetical protein
LKRLPMRRGRFYQQLRAGAFRHLEAVGPSRVIGRTVYSRVLVEQWLHTAAPILKLAVRRG